MDMPTIFNGALAYQPSLDNCSQDSVNNKLSQLYGHLHLDNISEREQSMLLDILENDDLDRYERLSAEHKHLLKHGKFEYDHTTHFVGHSLEKVLFEIPVYIAAGFGAAKLVTRLVEEGAELLSLDIGKSNIFHVMIRACKENRDIEEKLVGISEWLCDHVKCEILHQLFRQENESGHQPLELAAKYGTFGIFKTLVEQSDMAGRVEKAGLARFRTFNISEYESGSFKRMLRSPMRYLVYLKEDGLASCKKYGILEMPIIKEWMKYKMKITSPVLTFWLLFRSLYIVLTLLINSSVLLFEDMECVEEKKQPDNRTVPDETTNTSDFVVYEQCQVLNNLNAIDFERTLLLADIVTIWSIVMICIDVLELGICLLHPDRRRAYAGLYNPFKDWVSYSIMYRLCTFVLYLVAAVSPLTTFVTDGGTAYILMMSVKAAQLPLILISSLQILEFAPYIGILAVTMEKMLGSLVAFLLIFMGVKVVFAQFFMEVAASKGFTDISQSIFLLFMTDMGNFDFGKNPMPLIKIVFVLYFLMMGILLVNYLIGVLSIVAERSDDEKHILVILRRQQTVNQADERVAMLLRKFYYHSTPKNIAKKILLKVRYTKL